MRGSGLQGAASAPARAWWRTVWLWGPVLVQMALIFSASAIPELQEIPGGVSDRTAHMAVYGLLSALLVRALSGGRWEGVTWRVAALAVVLATAYGVSDEWHQSFVPGRTPDVWDVVADTVGAAAAAGALWAWSIIRAVRPR